MRRRPRIHWNTRNRERSLWWGAALVGAAVPLAVAPSLQWPTWVQAVVAGFGAAVPLLVGELRQRAGQRDTSRQLLEQQAILGKQGQLPLVKDASLKQLRVHEARVQIAYIERDQQEQLEAAVGPGKAALIVGHSMAGKTRLAVEVIMRLYPRAPVLLVETGKALREVIDGGLDPAKTVIWLDDLERFLGSDGLTLPLLTRLLNSEAIVVATIRSEQRERYRPLNELRPPEWEVLQQFHEITLKRRLSGAERDRVEATVTDPGVLAAVDHYGLAEYLGAGPEAVDAFEKGETTHPIGHALVQAAIDWRRVGFIRGIPKSALISVLPAYLIHRPDIPRTDQAIDEDLRWATAKINETVALLGQQFPDTNGPVFEAFDYLVDTHSEQQEGIPDALWTLALEQSEPVELFDVGLAAYNAKKWTIAEEAWRRNAESEDEREETALSAFNLGVLLKEQGDIVGARAAYERAEAKGDTNAIYSLGNLLREQEDVDGAKAVYLRAEAKGIAYAASNLGVLLEEQGDIAGAQAAYLRAEAKGDDVAAFNLGVLLAEQGDGAGAIAAYLRAEASGDARVACNLGVLLKDQGDVAGASAAFQRAEARGDADAAFNLGIMLTEQGDAAGAIAAYQRAEAKGNAKAAYNLGILLEEQGNLAEARATFQRTEANRHSEVAPRAAAQLKQLPTENASDD